MTLVAGVDSSTQSCKVVVRDADTGALIRHGSAPHPDGTEVDPAHWETALRQAIAAAGGIDDVAAVSIGGQQHGAVCLDESGNVVRPALLWNDTRSAAAADQLVAEIGAQAWVDATGSVPVASFTVTKLRWIAAHEPDNARRIAAVCLPHDWLTWRLRGAMGLDDIVTDRSDASGTGYFDSVANSYRRELVTRALGHDVLLPRVLGPGESVAWNDRLVGAGAGDNAAAAIGVAAGTDVLAQENVEELLPLPADFTGEGDLFMLRVRGDSMIEAGILDGDYVVARQQPVAVDGDIVVAGIPGDEATIKTFSRQGSRVVLKPANARLAPMEFSADDVRVFGKVVTVLRRL